MAAGTGVERAHEAALAVAAATLLGGLSAGNPAWLSAGVALLLALPLLRVAAAALAAAHQGSLLLAAAGVLVVALLVTSLASPGSAAGGRP